MLVVTEEADDPTLLSIAELRAAVNVTDTSQDAKLTTLGKRVSSSIAKACKVVPGSSEFPLTLRLETLTETIRAGCYLQELFLSRKPIVEVTSVTEGGSLLSASDYEIDVDAGKLTRVTGNDLGRWLPGKIVVVYSAGWDVVPDDLKLAAAKLAQILWVEGSRTDPSLRSESIPGVIDQSWWVGPAEDPLMSAEIEDLLSHYKRLTIV